jgi:hypothetical protein
MTATFDNKTELWEVSHDIYPITVRGPERSICEEKLAELAAWYRAIIALREPKPEDLLLARGPTAVLQGRFCTTGPVRSSRSWRCGAALLK